eukprot:2767724-Rhodomonas_salina.9
MPGQYQASHSTRVGDALGQYQVSYRCQPKAAYASSVTGNTLAQYRNSRSNLIAAYTRPVPGMAWHLIETDFKVECVTICGSTIRELSTGHCIGIYVSTGHCVAQRRQVAPVSVPDTASCVSTGHGVGSVGS